MQTKILAMLAVIAAAGVALLLPTRGAHAAETGLLERVNEAIREAGAQVTVERSNAFQVGVINGSYTSFEQLVGAVAYHKKNETLPEFSSTNPPKPTTECITGNVLSFSDTSLSVKGDNKQGNLVTVTLKIATNQYDFGVAEGVKAGESVTTCSADGFVTQYGHVTVN